MGWAVKFYAEFDELYCNEIIFMLKWLENPFDRDCLTPVLVYQSPYGSSKRVADRHAVGLLVQLLVEQLCFCFAKRYFRGILSRTVRNVFDTEVCYSKWKRSESVNFAELSLSVIIICYLKYVFLQSLCKCTLRPENYVTM